jgi:NTE family protein
MADENELALVLGGGGARAAYQVGVLSAIASHCPAARPAILTGTSAGAINTAFVANHPGSWEQGIAELAKVWLSLGYAQVFRADAVALFRRAFGNMLRITVGSGGRKASFEGMVDATPLRATLCRVMSAPAGVLSGIARNLARGRLKAVALTTTCYSTGQTVTFVSGSDIAAWRRPQRKAVPTELTVDHVMASAALPFFFPAVRIGEAYYGDGGIRIVAPLSPSIHLGARKILAISTRYHRTVEEADRPIFEGPPSPAQVLGLLYNAIFLDMLDQDALTMARVNRLIADSPPEIKRGLRPVELLVLRPSRDLGALANDFEPDLPPAFRYLTRRLGTRRARSQDMLSTVMFQHDYVRVLFELGLKDGEREAGRIREFLNR